MSSGTITLRRPRVRGVEERFESRVLPLFARRTKELGALLPELYLHGLAEGDFELAMRGLLGEGAPLSKSSIRRLRAGWTAEFEEWSQRRLEGREVVYVWADGHDHTPTPSGSGRRGAVRESGAAVVREADEGAGRSASGAVSARTGGGRLRAGDAGTARRGGTAVEVFDPETAGGMDGGVRGMEPASPGGP